MCDHEGNQVKHPPALSGGESEATNVMDTQSGGETHGSIDFGIDILGRSDADYAKYPDSKSVSGWSVFMNGGLVTSKCKGQPTVSLSVTESEGNAGTSCVQDMLFVKRVIESMKLKVNLPMILEVDNK